MLSITFAGWAVCRLPTDPDPYDEPRGVSGYMRAYAGEPDLDRIIRFQAPPFVRAHGPSIGVTVQSISLDGHVVADHPLLRAEVHLLGDAKFEGRNGVISEDAREPICPFDLSIVKGADQLRRATVPSEPRSPYREFNARHVIRDAGFIERATTITSLVGKWNDRIVLLQQDLAAAPPDARPGLEERIDFLRRNIAARGGGVAGFFPVRMLWSYRLRSEVQPDAIAPPGFLRGFKPTTDPWDVHFWIGGWDADAQAFFVGGTLDIAERAAPPPTPVPLRRPERMSDIE
jgi:hypothetical protein